MIGMQCKWDAFADPEFKESLGKLFEHEDLISREGWARYYFDGKFKKDVAYLRLRIINPSTDQLSDVFYFKFTKNYLTSLDGRTYIKDPITNEKIVKNGYLEEVRNVKGKFVLSQYKFVDSNTYTSVNVFRTTSVKYSEKAKAVFLVTPPHLMKYAKLILILLKQLVDLNFEKSYMTKDTQKPLYKTRFMLDELG